MKRNNGETLNAADQAKLKEVKKQIVDMKEKIVHANQAETHQTLDEAMEHLERSGRS